MSVEIVDKRNNKEIQIGALKIGDHCIADGDIVVITECYEHDTVCTSVANGTEYSYKVSTKCQQVHLVITVHLV